MTNQITLTLAGRTYDQACALRAVTSADGLTAATAPPIAKTNVPPGQDCARKIQW
jgi:GMP synthase PP-ATPase subunit